jgi:4-aminobutyrate aminotransferase-like enzyme
LAQLRRVHPVHVGAQYGVAIHRGYHIVAMRAVASTNQKKRNRKQARNRPANHAPTIPSPCLFRQTHACSPAHIALSRF